MVHARTLALSLLLACGCAATAPKPAARAKAPAVDAGPQGRADALSMRDLSRVAPESEPLGSLKPVPVGTESLGKRATAAK